MFIQFPRAKSESESASSVATFATAVNSLEISDEALAVFEILVTARNNGIKFSFLAIAHVHCKHTDIRTIGVKLPQTAAIKYFMGRSIFERNIDMASEY